MFLQNRCPQVRANGDQCERIKSHANGHNYNIPEAPWHDTTNQTCETDDKRPFWDSN